MRPDSDRRASASRIWTAAGFRSCPDTWRPDTDLVALLLHRDYHQSRDSGSRCGCRAGGGSVAWWEMTKGENQRSSRRRSCAVLAGVRAACASPSLVGIPASRAYCTGWRSRSGPSKTLVPGARVSRVSACWRRARDVARRSSAAGAVGGRESTLPPTAVPPPQLEPVPEPAPVPASLARVRVRDAVLGWRAIDSPPRGRRRLSPRPVASPSPRSLDVLPAPSRGRRRRRRASAIRLTIEGDGRSSQG
jgi:hypothetical protein